MLQLENFRQVNSSIPAFVPTKAPTKAFTKTLADAPTEALGEADVQASARLPLIPVIRTALVSLGLALSISVSPAFADNQPPSIVNSIFTSAVSDSSIHVSWNKPWDDFGIAGYNIYRDGSYYDTATSTNYIDKGALSGTLHDYQISAFDFSGNYSALSAVASARTHGIAPPAPQFDPGNNNNAGADRPKKPYQLGATVLNGNSIRLSWQTPESQRRVTGYNVHRDGAYVTWVSGNEYNEPWIEWNKDYSYTVVAIDDKEKFSDPSDPIVVNTASESQASEPAESSQPQPQPQPQPVAPSQPQVNNPASNNSAVPDGYRLVFADEFQSNDLDGNKWNSSYRWGSTWVINSEKQFYVDQLTNPWFGYKPFTMDGEYLYITATPTPDYLKQNAIGQPYLSGALTTYNKFKMKYGYVEMRAKLPRGKGLWSAFWLLHQHDHERRPEIDVMEHIGDEPSLVYNTYHWVDGWNARKTPSYESWGPDYSQDFHTFGMKWEPNVITWYVDGVARHQVVDTNVSWEEMYLLVNLAVGGWWPGDPDWTTKFPATMTVDYIRAYQP